MGDKEQRYKVEGPEFLCDWSGEYKTLPQGMNVLYISEVGGG